jgi:hypothetical protein
MISMEVDPMIALQDELRLNMPSDWRFNIKLLAQNDLAGMQYCVT